MQNITKYFILNHITSTAFKSPQLDIKKPHLRKEILFQYATLAGRLVESLFQVFLAFALLFSGEYILKRKLESVLDITIFSFRLRSSARNPIWTAWRRPCPVFYSHRKKYEATARCVDLPSFGPPGFGISSPYAELDPGIP